MSEQQDTERDMIDLKSPEETAPKEASAASDLSQEELERVTTEIVAALKTVYDPEIPVDIYELGLIYKVDFEDNGRTVIDMTLTAPGCPVAGEMPIWVQKAVEEVEGVGEVKVNMTFEPPWTMDMMSDEAKLHLGWM